MWKILPYLELVLFCRGRNDLWPLILLKRFAHCCKRLRWQGIIHCSPSSGTCRPVTSDPCSQQTTTTGDPISGLKFYRVWSSSLSKVCDFVSDNTQTGPQILLLSSNKYKYFGRKAFLEIAFLWVQIFTHWDLLHTGIYGNNGDKQIAWRSTEQQAEAMQWLRITYWVARMSVLWLQSL